MIKITLILVILTYICSGGYFYYHSDLFEVLMITFGTCSYHFLMRLVVGALIPQERIDPSHRWFKERSWEPAFYKVIKIKSWKNSMPTFNQELFSVKDLSYQEILQNMCGAEVVHEVIIVLSFLPLLCIPYLGGMPAFLITSILAALVDLSFVCLQRFNRPRIVKIIDRRKKRS